MNLSTLMTFPDGTIGAYERKGREPDAPVVLVLQEIFGVNDNIRRTVDRLAEQGYHAVAPDLFWRQRPGADLNPDLPESRVEATALMDGYVRDGERNMDDLQRILRKLRAEHRKVAVVGYCLGGRMSLLCWLHGNVDAAVVYYGVNMVPALAKASFPTGPLLMHLGHSDPLNPPEVQQQVVQFLKDARSAQVYIHVGVGHAFARLGASSYVEAAAVTADRRTLDFLKEHLG
ncbi:carboxymethylenebutenolidase [Variovorax sp. YR752]|uniref:dienelactone hydrolase family protein n=1 Tax=unclassified Variovorax TaxID=663243 RepID=UPI000BD12B62|nr:dienelactone hydrolase family protein [Variovorax sp. YR752]SOE06303.1 carboxymethylenebutenolidase [Variovorax sp. YR752]